MPIFHFDIADGVRLEDPVGLDCADASDEHKSAGTATNTRAARSREKDVMSDFPQYELPRPSDRATQ